MPAKEVVFAVKLPLKSVWSFMIDRREVGCLFPGCKGVKLLNDLDSVWTLRFSFGPFTRTIEMKAHTTEMIENEHMSWTAVGDHIRTSGFVWVRRISDDETEVTYRLEGHVTGHFSMLQDIVVAEKLSEITKAFMKNIKDRLEGSADK